MISIPGKYYDGKSSQDFDVILVGDANGHIRVKRPEDGHIIVSVGIEDVTVSPRLANTPRYLCFPDGEKFETLDNAKFDKLLNQFYGRSWLDIIHLLESRTKYVLIALGILIFFIWGSVRYVVPGISEHIAFHLPLPILQHAGSQTLDFLDRSVFKPSELEIHRQKHVLTHFQQVIDDHSDLDLKIYFRKGGSLGPNAFALPNGIVIFTDEMIETAEHEDELLAILLHETGHIVHRHGIRTIIQNSFMGFALLGITGDVSGSSELFLGLPVFLTQMAYSRNFEREADEYALQLLRQKDIPTEHFVRLMERIEHKMAKISNASDKKWLSYLSSHPGIKERLTRFRNETK